MKKLLWIVILTLMLLVPTNNQKVSANICLDQPPEVESIQLGSWNIYDGDPFTMGVSFYNSCGYTIEAVMINGVIYTREDGDIVNQGYTSSFLPGAYRQYLIQIPMIYDLSMGDTFTITHFAYSEWEPGQLFPESYVVEVNSDYQDSSVMFPELYDLPSDNTTEIPNVVEYQATYYQDSITFTNLTTGTSDNVLYSELFWDGLYTTHVVMIENFYSDPLDITNLYITKAIEAYATTSSLENLNTQDLLIYLMNNGHEDELRNKATTFIFEAAEEPLPEDYMFWNGEWFHFQLDSDGNMVLDSDGNPVAYSEPDSSTNDDYYQMDPDSFWGKTFSGFNESIQQITGWVSFNIITPIEWLVNHWEVAIVGSILFVVSIFTFSWWFPLVTLIILQTPTVLKVVKIILDKSAKLVYGSLSKGYQRAQSSKKVKKA